MIFNFLFSNGLKALVLLSVSFLISCDFLAGLNEKPSSSGTCQWKDVQKIKTYTCNNGKVYLFGQAKCGTTDKQLFCENTTDHKNNATLCSKDTKQATKDCKTKQSSASPQIINSQAGCVWIGEPREYECNGKFYLHGVKQCFGLTHTCVFCAKHQVGVNCLNDNSPETLSCMIQHDKCSVF